jgi:preprotein translocase subunit SecD
MSISKPLKVSLLILFLTIISLYIVLPAKIGNFSIPRLNYQIGNLDFGKEIELKQGLDIKGGLQVILMADMKDIPDVDKASALEALKTNIGRRIDPLGVSESGLKTAVSGNDYRLIIELPGETDPQEALKRIGRIAKMEFALPQFTPGKTATDAAEFAGFISTDLTGDDLKSASVTFESQDRSPAVSLVFKDSGRDKFAKLTKENLGKPITILLDGVEISSPVVQSEIIDGQAQITGKFTTEEAKALSVQLNAGALPVPVSIISQKNIPATLGADSIQKSLTAGSIGLFMVIFFMIAYYGKMGFIASLGLILYGLYTLTLYKLIPVVLSLPGIAGFLLSVGMAVDSNILVFERYQEEIRAGRDWRVALELAFGRAWDSIKDANTATIITGLILLNPLDWPFLNTSGSVKGFALTLILGIFISLFTGIIVTRNLLRLFFRERTSKNSELITNNSST